MTEQLPKENPVADGAVDLGVELVTGVAQNVLQGVIDKGKNKLAPEDVAIKELLARKERKAQGKVTRADRWHNFLAKVGMLRSDDELLEMAGLKRD